jgi:hypothetical protein
MIGDNNWFQNREARPADAPTVEPQSPLTPIRFRVTKGGLPPPMRRQVEPQSPVTPISFSNPSLTQLLSLAKLRIECN